MARMKLVLVGNGMAGMRTLEELLPEVYDDVPARVHPVAARSLRAHLDKLLAEGRVRAQGDRFALAKSAPAG